MPKIKLPPNIQKLKEQLETGHNLVDHFLVCGIPPLACLQDFLYEPINEKYEENFKENIKPVIISKFPEFDNSIDSIDDEIINYCFPEGFAPIITPSKGIGGKIFSVILDNNLFSAEHPQKYLSCLLFYEKLSVYKDLKSKLEKKKDVLDIDEIEETEETEVIDESTKTKTEKKTEKEEGETIKDEIKEKNENEIKENEIKENKENEIKEEEKEKEKKNKNINIYATTISKDNNSNQFGSQITEIKGLKCSTFVEINKKTFLKRSSFISENNNVFIPKCICIVSIHPYLNLFRKILQDILQYISEPRDIPIEKIITNLIIEVPIPPRGLYSIDYILMEKTYTLEGCENNKIQVNTEIDLKKFNSSLDFKTKLEAIKHILLGSKILFFSKNLDSLCNTILSFLILLFPFKYPFQVTSFLHKDSYNILESISPFMIGINEHYKESFFDQNEITVDGMNIFIIDLDKKKSYLLSDEEFPNFPSKMLSTLEKDIKNLESKFKKDETANYKEFNILYQNLFFEFFCEILRGYEDFLNMDYFKSSDQDKVTSIDTLFQCPKFIKTRNSSDVAFYKKFIDDSQLFADFIYKRMIPRNNQEIIDVLLVNETNIKIKNKQKYFGAKESTDFLDSHEYKPSNKYIVPIPRKLTNEEITNIKKVKETLLSFGQNIDDKEEIIFNYNLFPQLNFQIYCNNNNVNDYYPPPDYSEEIEAINSDLLSKSSIGQNINLCLEMKNNLALTWLEIWAYTFWYVDKEERKYRFDQMLDMLDKVVHHEMNIFNLMFEVLDQENEQKMIVRLYQKILQLKINPSTFIYNIISNRLDKEQIKELFDEMKAGKKNTLKFGGYDKSKFNRRTFLDKLDKPSLINKKLTFDKIFSCIECGENIDLLKLCEDFEGIKNDILWAPCKNGHYNLPKIKVNFGVEMFPFSKKDSNKVTTSVTNEIVLHSPYNLKVNVKNAVTTHYGNKLKVNDFKSSFSPLFWNFVWYSTILRIDYDIILPYLKKIEQEKATKTYINPNNDKIKLIYDNNLFKGNIEKLSKIDFDNVGQDSGPTIIIKSTFKDLHQHNVISIEIQKAVKAKNKKYYSKFIDHLKLKNFSVSEINGPVLSKAGTIEKNDLRGSASIPTAKGQKEDKK